MPLKRVTFTGADETTDVADLMALSETFSFVEWAILLPSKGRGRFPPENWLHTFIGASISQPFKVQTAGHLCGVDVAHVLRGKRALYECVPTTFPRVQLNTHGEAHALTERWWDPLMNERREIIIQLDGLASAAMLEGLEASGDDYSETFSGLHDLSHGAGVLPEEWPLPVKNLKWTGFAGGLGPQNLAEQLEKIEQASNGKPYWIDMETHVRTDGRFDLDKVFQCINIAEPFVERDA